MPLLPHGKPCPCEDMHSGVTQVQSAIQANNATLPAGELTNNGQSFEKHWQTIGMIGEETGRLISVCKATAHERKAYEEGDF